MYHNLIELRNRRDSLLQEQSQLKHLPLSPTNGIRYASVIAHLALITGTIIEAGEANPNKKEHTGHEPVCSHVHHDGCTENSIPF